MRHPGTRDPSAPGAPHGTETGYPNFPNFVPKIIVPPRIRVSDVANDIIALAPPFNASLITSHYNTQPPHLHHAYRQATPSCFRITNSIVGRPQLKHIFLDVDAQGQDTVSCRLLCSIDQ